MKQFLLESDWIVVSFPIIRVVLVAIMFVCSLSVIVAVLLQSNSTSGGTNAISGVQESYYASNKGATKEGRLKRITISMGIIIAVCILLYLISLLINNPA